MSTRFSLGIDLGTSNSAVAADDFQDDRTGIVEISQILRPNQIGEKLDPSVGTLHSASRRVSGRRSPAAMVEPH